MKKRLCLLRSRRGATLTELLVCVALLCVVIGMLAALLPPAARTVRRMEDLNNAQMITATVLEDIRGELELAQGYIKCYSGNKIEDEPGADSGEMIEFKTDTGHVQLISAGGCEAASLLRADGGDLGSAGEVPDGKLHYRYYSVHSGNTYYCRNASGHVARAVETVFGKGFYDDYVISLHFTVAADCKTVTVEVTVSRADTPDTPVYRDSTVVDLRYTPPLKTEITATVAQQ